jgi:uncharacterized protein YbdZ (MbtH family)
MNIYGTKGNVVFSKSDAFSRYNYKEEVPDTWGATVYNFVLRYYRADPYQQKSYSVMTPEVWKNVMEVGKLQACIDYLGIAPEDFDVYDQTHIAARDRAIKETKTLMQELMRKYGWQ